VIEVFLGPQALGVQFLAFGFCAQHRYRRIRGVLTEVGCRHDARPRILLLWRYASMACSKHFIYQDSCAACRDEKLVRTMQETERDRSYRETQAAEAAERREQERLDWEERQRWEQQEREDERQQRQEEALRAAAIKHKQTVAQANRLQSADAAERAQELYAVGSWSGAFGEASRAIELDHGNIRAYRIAAQSLENQGREREALEYRREQIKLLGMSEHAANPHHFLDVLGSLPPRNVPLLEQFARKVLESAARWEPAARFAVLAQLFDTSMLNQAYGVLELLFSNARSSEQPQLFARAVRHLQQRPAAWLSQFSQEVFTGSASWAPHQCFGAIEALIDLKRLNDAESLLQSAFARADVKDQPELVLTALRRLLREGAWVSQFMERVAAQWTSWEPSQCLPVISQLIASARLTEAKCLADIVAAKSNSLELQALLVEANERLGLLSTDSLCAYLSTISYDRRSEVLSAFRPIVDSNRFSGSVVASLRKEISRRYLDWKPEIDRSLKEAARRSAPTSHEAVDNYAKQHKDFLGSPLALGWAIAIITADFGVWWEAWVLCFLVAPFLGWVGARVRRHQLKQAIVLEDLQRRTLAEHSQWETVLDERARSSFGLKAPAPLAEAGTRSKISVPSLLALALIATVSLIGYWILRSINGLSPDKLVSEYPAAACFVHDCPPCPHAPLSLERGASITFDLSSCFQKVDANADMEYSWYNLSGNGEVIRFTATGQKVFMLPHDKGALFRDRHGAIRSSPGTELGDLGRVGSRRLIEFAGTGRLQLSAK
jgi:hypothetical protein